MKLLAFSDVHGAYERVEAAILREGGADLVVIAGDLTTRGSRGEATRAIERFASLAPAVLVVAGNMDPPELEDAFLDLGVGINGRGVVHGAIGFCGVSAAPLSPLHTPYELTENEIAARAEQGWTAIEHCDWRVFVPHAPPANTKVDRLVHGKHVGSSAVRQFIEHHKPELVLCGHIHEARGADRLGSTQVINCGPAGKGSYAVVTIADTMTVELRG